VSMGVEEVFSSSLRQGFGLQGSESLLLRSLGGSHPTRKGQTSSLLEPWWRKGLARGLEGMCESQERVLVEYR